MNLHDWIGRSARETGNPAPERSISLSEIDAQNAEYIQSKQIELLHENAKFGLTATFVNSVLLVLALHDRTSPVALAIWLVCVFLIASLRVLSVRKYRHAPSKACTNGLCVTRFILGAGLSGLVWGSAGVWLFPVESMPHQTVVAFVLGGMAAGAAVVYSPVKWAFLAFIIPDLVPVTIRFYIEATPLHVLMAIMLTLFLALMLVAAFQMHRVTLESLALRFQNVDLTGSLREAKEGAELLVSGLRSQMAERERAEEALQKSERMFRMLIETMNEGLGVYDREGIITFVNDKTCQLSGYSREELLGRSITSFFDEENRPLYEAQTAKRGAGETSVYEVELLSKHGRRTPCIVSASPFVDENGELGGAIVVVTDISTLKQSEKARRESEQKYRMIFENSPLGIVYLDPAGIISACNDSFAEKAGYVKERLVGFNAIAPLKDGGIKAAFRRCLAGEVGHYEGPCLLRSGKEPTLIRASYSPVVSEDGVISGCMGIVEDITERKLAEEELRKSEKQLRLLSTRLLSVQEDERKRIAGELHDSISSSLSAIKFSLENIVAKMELGMAASEQLRAVVEMSRGAIEEVRRIMTDLRPSMLDDMGLIATIGWFCRQFQSIYSGIHIEKEIDIEEGEIPDCLKIVIFRIMQEAFHNIAKYSRAEFVAISLAKKNNALELIIEDNGVGFDPDAVLKNGQAKGFGLTSMRERVELSQGSFTLESMIGVGTIIRACWPL